MAGFVTVAVTAACLLNLSCIDLRGTVMQPNLSIQSFLSSHAEELCGSRSQSLCSTFMLLGFVLLREKTIASTTPLQHRYFPFTPSSSFVPLIHPCHVVSNLYSGTFVIRRVPSRSSSQEWVLVCFGVSWQYCSYSAIISTTLPTAQVLHPFSPPPSKCGTRTRWQ